MGKRKQNTKAHATANSSACFATPALVTEKIVREIALKMAVLHTPSRPRGAFRPSFASSLHPLVQEGAGKAGCRLAPAVRCAKM
jgi:hypothetical protein